MKLDVYLRNFKKKAMDCSGQIESLFVRQSKRIAAISKKIFADSKNSLIKIRDYRDVVGYYAVLAVVLVALSAAAYDYRGKKNERVLLEANPTIDPGMAVQMQTDPTLRPDFADTEFILPVFGKIINEFADDELVWSTTLQLWQTHPALDIAASAGEAVVAAADGEIVEAYSDALLGNTIVIDHGKDRLMKYASLNTLEMVKVGQRVRQGDIIGSVGVCMAEAEFGAHIHLEYTEGGEEVDFLLLLSEGDRENLRD